MSKPTDDDSGAYARSEDFGESPSLWLRDLTRRPRDQKLWDLLTPPSYNYDPVRLSKRELSALEEALGDGFGGRFDQGSSASDLPPEVQKGLLQHSFYSASLIDDDGDHWGPDIWDRGDDGAPAPFEVFPLVFDKARLRIYFRSQFERYCHYFTDEELTLEDTQFTERVAFQQLYEKPWYEVHALQFLDWIEDSSVRSHVAVSMKPIFAGQLVRLFEQYYWRFRYERAAITGLGARSGASAGGKARAAQLQKKQARWRRAADEIRKQRPKLNAEGIAAEVKRKLKLKETPKHIARYLRPLTKI